MNEEKKKKVDILMCLSIDRDVEGEDTGVHSPEKSWSVLCGQDIWCHSKFDIRRLQAVIKDSVTKTVRPFDEIAVDSKGRLCP